MLEKPKSTNQRGGGNEFPIRPEWPPCVQRERGYCTASLGGIVEFEITEGFVAALTAAFAGVIAGLVGLAAYFAALAQNRVSATAFAGDWIRDLRSWGSEAIDVLADASYSCPKILEGATEDEQARLKAYRAKLSALIDRGRLLLPNVHAEHYGHTKERAYRGFRHDALDALIAAECILDGQPELFEFPNPKVALIGLRREFVSIIQAILDPSSTNRTVAKYLRQAHDDRKRDLTLGGLLPDPQRDPQGDMGLLFAASIRYKNANRKIRGRNRDAI
jgi:hypothetical protein